MEFAIILEYIVKVSVLIGRYKEEELIKRLDRLTEKTLKKIKDNDNLKKELKEIYEKTIKKYIKAIGYNNLELIKE